MLRSFALMSLFALMAIAVNAQITVGEYPMKLRADVDELSSISAPIASSSCGEVVVTIDDQLFSGGCLGTLARTYTFTDGCGNVERAQQFINLEDYTPPVFDNLSESLSVVENAVPETSVVTASDNSNQPVQISVNETREGNVITRIYTATDQCGNTSIGTQTISVKN